MTEFRNILVRTTNWVGDAVMTLPALRALRRALPAARITLLAKPWVSAVFEREDVCDRIMLYEVGQASRPAPLQKIAGLRRIAAELRAQNFDAALLLQNAFEAALVARWAGIPMRAGYARDGRSPLLTHPVAVPGRFEIPAHECYYYLELLRRLGIIDELPEVKEIALSRPPKREAGRRKLAALGVPVDDEVVTAPSSDKPGAPLPEGSLLDAPGTHPLLDEPQKTRFVQQRVGHPVQQRVGHPVEQRVGQAMRHPAGSPIVAINAGAAFGTAKRWLPERFAETGRELVRRGARAVLFGSAAESPLAESLQGDIGPEAVSIAGRTSLAEFLDVVAGCDLFLTNDTGTMHLAAAAGVPVVAVFGPTDEVATPPLGPFVRIVKNPVGCSPCKLRHCPLDHRCMLGVTVEQVLAACEEALASGVRGQGSGVRG